MISQNPTHVVESLHGSKPRVMNLKRKTHNFKNAISAEKSKSILPCDQASSIWLWHSQWLETGWIILSIIKETNISCQLSLSFSCYFECSQLSISRNPVTEIVWTKANLIFVRGQRSSWTPQWSETIKAKILRCHCHSVSRHDWKWLFASFLQLHYTSRRARGPQ